MRARAVRPPRSGVLWVLSGVLVLLVAGCSSGPRTSTQAAEGSLAASADLGGQSYVVGGKDALEQRVLCEITVAALESAGAGVTDRCGGGYDARAALVSGEINLYWEDTGTARATFLRDADPSAAGATDPAVAERDLAANGVVWLERAAFPDSHAFTVAGPEAARLRLHTLSDMAGYLRSGQPGTVCTDPDYAARDDGMAAVARTYAVTVPPDRTQVLDAGLVPQSTADGVCTFGEVSSTDGRVASLGLTVLADDKGAHTVAYDAPTIRKDAFDRDPGVARVLDPISTALDMPTVVALNRRVTTEGVAPRDAARDWLTARGFIDAG